MKSRKPKKNMFRCSYCDVMYPDELIIFVPSEFFLTSPKRISCGCCPGCSIQLVVDQIVLLKKKPRRKKK